MTGNDIPRDVTYPENLSSGPALCNRHLSFPNKFDLDGYPAGIPSHEEIAHGGHVAAYRCHTAQPPDLSIASCVERKHEPDAAYRKDRCDCPIPDSSQLGRASACLTFALLYAHHAMPHDFTEMSGRSTEFENMLQCNRMEVLRVNILHRARSLWENLGTWDATALLILMLSVDIAQLKSGQAVVPHACATRDDNVDAISLLRT